jgi:tRNA threonylcarbamoyladenosine biosynthesis protein TsaB
VKLLALDTSTPTACLALLTETGQVLQGAIPPGPRHGRTLVPAIQALLRSAGCSPKALDAVAVGLGPGSYTGLRIGVTAAKMLAYAAGCRLLPLDSMELIARNAPPEYERIAVVVDAQRHDLYVADFRRSPSDSAPKRLGPTRFASSEPWIAELSPSVLALGPGLQRFPAFADADPSRQVPQAGPMIAAALAALEVPGENDWTLEPLYLRRSAAEDLWDARRKPAGKGVER